MVDAWLVVVIIVMSIVILVASLYFLVYFSSPDDKNQAWIPKIVTVTGLCLACWVVLMLPLGVADRNSSGGLNLDILWQVLLMVVAGFAFVIVPFCIFYYEEHDPESGILNQLKNAVLMTLGMVIIAGLTIGLMYAFLGFSEIPYMAYSAAIAPLTSSSVFGCIPGGSGGCGGSSGTLSIQVSLVIYIIAMIAFIGYFLLMLFGGIGLIALPLDMLAGYANRPKRLEPSERAKVKLDLNTRATKLIQAGKELEARKRGSGGNFDRKGRKLYLAYKQTVYFLECDFEKLRLIEKEAGGSPFKWWAMLAFGFLGIFVSMAWLLHLLLYMFIQPPVTPFLNILFVDLDNVFALFGTIAYGLFAFYLLWCVVKGCIKFGLRFLCFAIHPMKVGDTLMNSFLFNVGMILFASVAVTQLCSQAFDQYARNSSAVALFGATIKYLKGLKYCWQYYLYFLFAVSGLTLLYLIIWPKDKGKEVTVDAELIRLKGGLDPRKTLKD